MLPLEKKKGFSIQLLLTPGLSDLATWPPIAPLSITCVLVALCGLLSSSPSCFTTFPSNHRCRNTLFLPIHPAHRRPECQSATQRPFFRAWCLGDPFLRVPPPCPLINFSQMPASTTVVDILSLSSFCLTQASGRALVRLCLYLHHGKKALAPVRILIESILTLARCNPRCPFVCHIRSGFCSLLLFPLHQDFS
jgi:hypothetical protein